ncbi:hypothetical protein GCM10025867_46120 (plasmid) [Frondihabitans sucicola]|uniref:Uncharacterized protein n=1 Tax=Frondihabitans sucicola TaxID=1268041 RepID=A0ABM8GVH1_9MICO|nr:hypothetical protein [Frondihabitans sucicola]BDZ52371.1 hypothetical protein GCM10025867_46120 [Frondihabitans sucicola]
MTDIDITALAAEVRAALAARGIPDLDVVMDYDTDVFVPYPQVSVEEAFDLAKATAAPFAILQEQRFDPNSLEEEDDDEKLPIDIRRDAEAHAGQPDTLFAHWIGGSIKYAFVATPDWRTDLNRRAAAWRSGVEVAYEEKRQIELARIRELALELEALPELRASSLQGRKMLAERLVDGLKRDSDEPHVLFYAVRGAVAMVRENSFNAFADLEGDLAATVAAVRTDEHWIDAYTKPARTEVVTNVLRALSDGYGAPLKLVDAVRREAERLERA